MAKKFRGRWGISGPQPGFGVRGTGRKLKPGGRVTREGAFPETGGRTLSRDDDGSTFRKSAKTGAARIKRLDGVTLRESGGPVIFSDEEDEDELSNEEEEEEEEEEPDSDDLEEYEDPKKKKKEASKKAALEKKKAASRAKGEDEEYRRQQIAEAVTRRLGVGGSGVTKVTETITLGDSSDEDDSEEDGGGQNKDSPPRKLAGSDFEDWIRTNNPQMYDQYLAEQNKSKSKSKKRPLFRTASEDEDEIDATQPRTVASSSSTVIKKFKAQQEVIGGQAFVTRSYSYDEAPKMRLSHNLIRKKSDPCSDEEEEEEEDEDERKLKIRVSKVKTGRLLEEEKKFKKIEKVAIAKKRQFKANREPGYSNRKRN